MSICNTDNNYNYFIGSDQVLDTRQIFNYFDVNYLPLENLPIAYYPLNIKTILNLITIDNENKKFIENYLKKKNEEMDSKDNNFNNYNIYYMSLILAIFLMLIIINFLRLIQFYYPIYYTYILLGIIIFILVITSLWFLYVNTVLI